MQAGATAVGLTAVVAVKGKAVPRSVTTIAAALPSRRARAVAGRVRAAVEAAEVDYASSNVSVFPMEACELVGGEACQGQMYPETKLTLPASQSSSSSSAAAAAAKEEEEEVERDYLAYDEPKTVFPGEACDDLGGEFCEAPYQTGVSSELALA